MPKIRKDLTLEMVREQTRLRVAKYRLNKKYNSIKFYDDCTLDDEWLIDNNTGNNGGW
jgi:hypothetical protein